MNFSGSGRPSVFGGGLKISAIPPTLLIPRRSPGSAKCSELLPMFFIHIIRFLSLRITPGFYPGIIKPVRNILRPRFLLIIPKFYPGFITGYYFRGPARLKRLLLYSGLPFLISFNAVTLQFVNWPSDKCGGVFRYPRLAFY